MTKTTAKKYAAIIADLKAKLDAISPSLEFECTDLSRAAWFARCDIEYAEEAMASGNTKAARRALKSADWHTWEANLARRAS